MRLCKKFFEFLGLTVKSMYRVNFFRVSKLQRNLSLNWIRKSFRWVLGLRISFICIERNIHETQPKMEEIEGAHDSQVLLRTGLALCVIASLFCFMISFIGGIFIVIIVASAFYGMSFFTSKQKSIGNLLRSYVPPRTKWCSKMEFDHILIPADVDESLER